MLKRLAKPAIRVAAVCSLVGMMTGFHRLIGLTNETTVALSLLLIVLAVATLWGLAESLIASMVATLCFNYFFLPPVGTWSIADPKNWVAMASFLVVSIVASQLSERARRKSREALQHQEEKIRLVELAKQGEIIRQNEEFKNTLLDALAHELKTPLTSVKACVSALRADGAANASEHGELLAIMEEETDRLNGLITELLQMSRVEVGKQRLNRERCRIEELVNASVKDSTKLLGGRTVNIVAETDLPEISADKDLIQTVLRYLIDNAAKYSTSGKPVEIRAAHENGQLTVSVCDHGPGMGGTELSKVFDRYYRGPDTAQGIPGMGIGLTIARDIVVAHGGRMWAESRPNAGTSFTFTLPLDREKA